MASREWGWREEESDVGGRGIWWNLGNLGFWQLKKKTQLPSGTVFKVFFKKIRQIMCVCKNTTYMTVIVFLQIWFGLGFPRRHLYNFQRLLLVLFYLRICLCILSGWGATLLPSQTFYTIQHKEKTPLPGILTIGWRIDWMGQSSFASLESGVHLG